MGNAETMPRQSQERRHRLGVSHRPLLNQVPIKRTGDLPVAAHETVYKAWLISAQLPFPAEAHCRVRLLVWCTKLDLDRRMIAGFLPTAY